MQRLFLLCLLFLAFAACQPTDKNGKGKVEYCTYIAGNDCPCYKPPIQNADVVCIPCDSGQKDCPNLVRIKLICPPRADGKRDTCDLIAKRQSTSCTTCPNGSKKLNKGDYLTVTIGD